MSEWFFVPLWTNHSCYYLTHSDLWNSLNKLGDIPFDPLKSQWWVQLQGFRQCVKDTNGDDLMVSNTQSIVLEGVRCLADDGQKISLNTPHSFLHASGNDGVFADGCVEHGFFLLMR